MWAFSSIGIRSKAHDLMVNTEIRVWDDRGCCLRGGVGGKDGWGVYKEVQTIMPMPPPTNTCFSFAFASSLIKERVASYLFWLFMVLYSLFLTVSGRLFFLMLHCCFSFHVAHCNEWEDGQEWGHSFGGKSCKGEYQCNSLFFFCGMNSKIGISFSA